MKKVFRLIFIVLILFNSISCGLKKQMCASLKDKINEENTFSYQ